MVLLRKVIGDVLRARRQAQHRTLREVSAAANVSLGYLSEIERGHKEASSELLASVCDALGPGLSDVLADVAATFALAEQVEHALAHPAEAVAVGAGVSTGAGLSTGTGAGNGVGPVEDSVTEGELTVSVRSDGPLRTTLTARRTPGQRGLEPLLVG